MPIRRLLLAVTAAAAALATAPTALAGTDAHSGPTWSMDHLTVTVTQSGRAGFDGRYELRCHPGGGNHPDTKAACDGLDEVTTWGKDPFAPVRPGTRCTMQYGGPARAHVSGHWAGHRVNARFSRENGCEMHRWDTLVPLLPTMHVRGPGHRVHGA